MAQSDQTHAALPAWKVWLPMSFFQAYLIATLATFAFGPIAYDIANPTTFYLYVLAGQLFMLFGYRLGTKRIVIPLAHPRLSGRLLKASIWVTLLLLPLSLTLHNYADISLVEAIMNPGMAYNARLESSEFGESMFVLSSLRGITAPLTRSLVPLGLIFWPRLAWPGRSVWGAAVFGTLAVALFSGAAIGVFEIVLIVPWMLWLQRHYHMPRGATHLLATSGDTPVKVAT